MKRSNWDTSSKDRGYGYAWQKLRDQVIRREGGWCRVCRDEGRLVHGNQCDHVKPKAQGGTDALSNLQLLCKRHHDIKSLKDRGYEHKPKGADEDGMPTDRGHPWMEGG